MPVRLSVNTTWRAQSRPAKENQMRRVTAGVLALLAVICLNGCQKPTEDTSYDVDDFVDTSVSPNPATADTSSGKTYRVVRGNNQPDEILQYDWKTTFTVNVTLNSHATDSDGADLNFPVTLSSASVKVQQASGGIVNPPTGGETEHYESVIAQATGNEFGGVNTSISTTFDVWYDLPSLRKEALATVTFTFQDNDGKTFSKVVDVKVAP
jgi:hypothetical protein